MINSIQTYTFRFTYVASLLLLAFFASTALAQNQNSLSLSVTPPLFQLTTSPGEYWASSVKVVNTNPYPLTVSVEVVNFDASGNAGAAKFTPIRDSAGQSGTLANWITLEKNEVTIPAEQSAPVSFSVSVPENAPPGGHYAAILVGNKSSSSVDDGPYIGVSSFVSSLLFVRIGGDVIESGSIREFYPENSFYQKPEASLSLVFENTGNVHLLPQGEITIYNMWGKKRGVIPINQKTDFGNVLPKSERKFSFDWSGDANPFEVGRYKAVTTLTFGQEERRSVYATTYFWVIPVVPVLIILSVLTLFVLFVLWMVRVYIKRALELQGIYDDPNEFLSPKHARHQVSMKVLTNPIVEGVMDLRSVGEVASQPQVKEQNVSTYRDWFKKYKKFFYGVGGSVVILGVSVIFFEKVLVPERVYDVTIKKDDKEISLSSEEIIKDSLVENKNYFNTTEMPIDGLDEKEISRENFELTILNSTSVPGRGAELVVLLERKGYMISRIGNARDEERQERSVVVGDLSATTTDAVIKEVEKISGVTFDRINSPASTTNTTALTFILGDR